MIDSLEDLNLEALRMHIMFICNEYPPAPHGGIGTFIYDLGHELSRLGLQISVVGHDPLVSSYVHQLESGIDVFRIPCVFKGLPRFAVGNTSFNFAELYRRFHLSRCLSKIIARYSPDIVESHDWSGPLFFKPRAPLVIRLHGSACAHGLRLGLRPNTFLGLFEKHNIRMANKIVAVSRYIANTSAEAFGISTSDVDILYNGINLSRFTETQNDRSIDEVLFVGRVEQRKGIEQLFRCIPTVLYHFPTARFKIVGRLPEGLAGKQYSDALYSTLPEKTRGSVTFCGHVPFDELPDIYSHATLAVFPSLAEAFGLVCAEAMACGCPVVMTNRGAGPEVVEHKVSGLVVDPDDTAALSNAILTLLRNAGLRRIYARNALSRVKEMFNLTGQAAKSVKLYCELSRCSGTFTGE